MPAKLDLTDQRFGKLIARLSTGKSTNGGVLWWCECDCGENTIVAAGYLRAGKTKSCGCLQKEKAAEFSKSRRKPGSAFRRLFAQYKSNAIKTVREFSLTEERFRELTSSDCHYCGFAPTASNKMDVGTEEYLYNGIDRVESSMGYREGNVVPCCWVCNQMKSTLNSEVFLEAVDRIHAHQARNARG